MDYTFGEFIGTLCGWMTRNHLNLFLYVSKYGSLSQLIVSENEGKYNLSNTIMF